MIREFFAPRVVMVYAIFWLLVMAGMYAWLKTKPEDHKHWITIARIPAIAGGVAVLATVAVTALLLLFN
jgi:hypothetical protein